MADMLPPEDLVRVALAVAEREEETANQPIGGETDGEQKAGEVLWDAARDVANCRAVCRSWRAAFSDGAVWRVLLAKSILGLRVLGSSRRGGSLAHLSSSASSSAMFRPAPRPADPVEGDDPWVCAPLQDSSALLGCGPPSQGEIDAAMGRLCPPAEAFHMSDLPLRVQAALRQCLLLRGDVVATGSSAAVADAGRGDPDDPVWLDLPVDWLSAHRQICAELGLSRRSQPLLRRAARATCIVRRWLRENELFGIRDSLVLPGQGADGGDSVVSSGHSPRENYGAGDGDGDGAMGMVFAMLGCQDVVPGGSSGLVGHYSFYNYRASCYLRPPGCATVAENVAGMMILAATSTCTAGGELLEEPQGCKGSKYLLADSPLSFLESHALDLLSGQKVRCKKNRVCGFPQKRGVQSETTHGVCITVMPMLVREHTADSEFFVVYKIRISMAKGEDPARSCTLTRRHWEIASSSVSGSSTDSGPPEREVVDGPGVVGLFPHVTPGSSMSYKSCTRFSDFTGFMEGFFEFRRDRTGETFRAAVPRFGIAESRLSFRPFPEEEEEER
jgi:uncharacterized protein affecting Mg2+/Co2+ transport